MTLNDDKKGLIMKLYFYKGPVQLFDMVIADIWQCSTYAVSEKKARSNFAYRFKKEKGLLPSSKILIPGTITMEGAGH